MEETYEINGRWYTGAQVIERLEAQTTGGWEPCNDGRSAHWKWCGPGSIIVWNGREHYSIDPARKEIWYASVCTGIGRATTEAYETPEEALVEVREAIEAVAELLNHFAATVVRAVEIAVELAPEPPERLEPRRVREDCQRVGDGR